MTVVYRTLRPGEEEATIHLWSRCLDVPLEDVRRDFHADPHRLEHTRVALAPDGEILAAVHYYLRHVRDSAGAPTQIGALAGVATLPAARSAGHASTLIARTLDAMLAEGCRWSMLFTEVNGFYERLGWRTFTTRYRQGILYPDVPSSRPGYRVQERNTGSDPALWDMLAYIHTSYNRARPLTVVRDRTYWREYAAPRFTLPLARLFIATVAERLATPVGYALAHFYDNSVVVTELGILPMHPDAISALLARIREVGRRCGIAVGRVYLPYEPHVDRAVAEHFTTVEEGYYHVLMARPLAPDASFEEIEATFAAPGAIAWPTDDF